MILHHLPLNTGHTASTDLRAQVALRTVLPVLRPIIRAGGGPVPQVPALTIQVPTVPAGAVFSLWHGPQPVAINTLAWNQANSAASSGAWPP